MIQKLSLIVLSSWICLYGCSCNDPKAAPGKKTTIADKSYNSEDGKFSEGSNQITADASLKEEKKNGRLTDEDGNWSSQNVVLGDTKEADWMIRIGDIDNLGFGWEEGFTPFSGRSTATHWYPWETGKDDAPGTDRIMIPSGYKNDTTRCGTDGYTAATLRPDNNPRPISLILAPLKTASIHSATLLLFVDDFQSPVLCSKFQAKLNNIRFIELEKLLNALQQTGPIGKLINIKLPDEFLEMLKADSLNILMDDPETGAGDGFAIDFVKLLVNPKDWIYQGNIKGTIIDKATRRPIANSTAEIKDHGQIETDSQGRFIIRNIPAGINIVTGSAPTYASSQVQADVIANETTDEIVIELSPSEKVTYNNKTMQEGDVLVLNNIQFELGSANLTDTGRIELNKLSSFMNKNPRVEILLSGYTSTDGTITFNKMLSINRVKTCKLYLMSKSIDEGRIEVIGYGSEKPVAPNDTEKNRSKNRRVEMKITKL
jgi:outer membrane protein OmpA-like peptidoglycan-associated protein